MMWGPGVARAAADLAVSGTTDVLDVSDLGLDRFDEHGRSRLAPDPIALPFPIRLTCAIRVTPVICTERRREGAHEQITERYKAADSQRGRTRASTTRAESGPTIDRVEVDAREVVAQLDDEPAEGDDGVGERAHVGGRPPRGSRRAASTP